MRCCFPYFLFCLFLATGLAGQDKPKTITLQKGQVFDIILLNNNPEAKDILQDYFKRAFPIAQANGYASGKGFGIIGTPTLGNYHPEVMATGTWPSLAARTKGLEALQTEMVDFDEMRRKIWPTFNLTYYEVKEDISFTLTPGKYYVATMFWAEKKGPFNKFKKSWEAADQRAGGKQVVVLTDGASPFGYHFNPDYFTITEWGSEAAFQASQRGQDRAYYPGVRHLNQFPIK